MGPGPFMAPSESQGRPRRADWHPKHFHTVCLDGPHPYHGLGPLLGPLLHSRAPKRARFGPERPFWGSPRVLEGPRGPDLVPTAPNWSDWVGVMVTTHFGLVLGLLWAPLGPKRARFGPKRPFWGSPRVLKGPRGPDLIHKLPPIGPTGLELWLPHTLPRYWVSPGPQGAPKGPVLAQNAPFGGPGGPWRAPGGQIWPQLLSIGPTGLKSWLSHTLAWYRASSCRPGAPKGPILALNVPFLTMWGLI